MATQALLWLNRAIEFVAESMRRNMDNPEEELSVSFSETYETTLSEHHNTFVQYQIETFSINNLPDLILRRDGRDLWRSLMRMLLR